MGETCQSLLDDIRSNPARRLDVLTKPRELHRELFLRFAPAGHDEYAGTYRGARGTSLHDRKVSSESRLFPGQKYDFTEPGEVHADMEEFLLFLRELLEQGPNSDYERLVGLAWAFAFFGKIHPFLDGNGHVQRAVFAALATEYGYPLSARFAIHPRPYDDLLGVALETFTKASSDTQKYAATLVAEYLGMFLDGPFNSPGLHIGRGADSA